MIGSKIRDKSGFVSYSQKKNPALSRTFEPIIFYLVQLIRTTNRNSEFLHQIFCLFSFWVFLQGKRFKSRSQYTQKCQYNSLS